jgi:hypothetical protein
MRHQDPGETLVDVAPTPSPMLPAALHRHRMRMHLHRANKRKGLKCYRARLTAKEVAAMVREGVAKDFTPTEVQRGIEAIVAEWLYARTIAH